MLALSTTSQLAKLTPPRLSQVAPRKTLFERLDFCRRRPATWLTSPAGSGKTLAVAKYLQTRELPTLWYQIDEGDHDLASFFYYLGLAVAPFAKSKHQPLPLLTPEYQDGGVQVFARNFFRKFFNRLPESTVVVFDNFQEAPEDSIQNLLQIALEEIPEHVNLFVISRNEPPAQYARLLAANALSMLGWNELKLSEEETFAVAKIQGQHALSPATLQLLHRETQGWVAGLVLLLNHTEQSLMHWQQTKSHELIFEFFAGEIFLAAGKDLQQFLLKTAFLPSISLGAAEELTGLGHADELLASLLKRNYFTSRMSNEKGSYGYHPLFRSFLLNKSKQLFSAQELKTVKRRAAQVLIKDEQPEPAVQLLLQAEDWDHASKVILQLARAMLSQGRSQTLRHWIGQFPMEFLPNQPWLVFWQAMCELNSEPLQAQKDFNRAFDEFVKQKDIPGMYLAWHGVAESVWYAQSDATVLDAWLGTFEKLYKQHPFPDDDVETRVVMSLLYAMYWRQPQHPDIQKWAERAQKMWYQTPDPNLRLHLGVRLSYYYGLTGHHLAKAQEFCATQEQLVEQKQLDALAVLHSKSMCGLVHIFSGRPQECLANVHAALELSEQQGIHMIDPMLLGLGIYASMLLQQIKSADDLLLRLCKVLSERPVNLDMASYQMLLAWRAATEDDTGRAYQHAVSAVELSEQLGAVYPELLCRLGVAQILEQQGEMDKAELELDLIRKRAQNAGFNWVVYHCDLASARCALSKNSQELGLRYLRKALQSANLFGYGLPLWYRSKTLEPLYCVALANQIEPDYVRKNIKQHQLLPPANMPVPDTWPWPLKIYTLGRFELYLDDEPLVSESKSQRKPLDLLKAVIALGGKDVNDNTLCDYLWPDAEGDSVRRSFDTNLHRLRKLIKYDKALFHKDFKLSLNPQYCWVDTWAFKRASDDMNALLGRNAAGEKQIVEHYHHALNLYRGPLLRQDTDEHWVYGEREKLHKRMMNIFGQVGGFYEKQKRWDDAIAIYQKGLEMDGLSEALYQRLIDIHQQLGHYAEALAVYERCKESLLNELGIHPSPVTENLMKNIVKNRAH